MLHSYILSLSLLLSILVYPIVSQSTLTFGFCFTDSSKPGSPYGPWSVATWGTLVVNATGYITAVDQHGGGNRFGYNVMSANAQRLQYNRDGSQSTATLGLCTTGQQGSDNILYNNSVPTSDRQQRTHAQPQQRHQHRPSQQCRPFSSLLACSLCCVLLPLFCCNGQVVGLGRHLLQCADEQ